MTGTIFPVREAHQTNFQQRPTRDNVCSVYWSFGSSYTMIKGCLTCPQGGQRNQYFLEDWFCPRIGTDCNVELILNGFTLMESVLFDVITDVIYY